MEDITKIDLYELLSLLPTATIQEVKKAYRKKALNCHPDKNPDNPKAVELFHQLSRALEILIDDSARAAYDKVLNAKKAALLRNKNLDAKRKKLKEDLECRERQSLFEKSQEKSADEKLQAEIERLRKEGSKQLEEEIELVRMQVEQEKSKNIDSTDSSLYRLRLNWKTSEEEVNIYNYNSLEQIFSKYGDITALVVSSKKKGSALLEFDSSAAAVKAQRLEKGFSSNPLTVKWLMGTPPDQFNKDITAHEKQDLSFCLGKQSIFPSVVSDNSTGTTNKTFPYFPSTQDIFAKNREEKQDLDFENMVLLKMKQIEEEKRINLNSTGSI